MLAALLVGSPEEVAKKILFEHELFHNGRFMAQIRVGTLSHDRVIRAIEWLSIEVTPILRKVFGRRSAAGSGGSAAGRYNTGEPLNNWQVCAAT